jgi:hypothetical protein
MFSLFFIKHFTVKAYGEVELERHTFLASAPCGGERSFLSPEADWVGTRSSLDSSDYWNLLLRPAGRPNVIPPSSSPQFSHYTDRDIVIKISW